MFYTFLAIVEKVGKQQLDDNEFIRVEEFDEVQIQELINNDDFIHAPSLICWTLSRLNSN